MKHTDTLKYWPIECPFATANLYIRGLALDEPMSERIVDRPNGIEGHHVLIQFHEVTRLRLNGAWERCPAQSLVLWRPGEPHVFGSLAQDWTQSWITCGGSFVEDQMRFAGLPSSHAMVMPDASLIHELVSQVHRELAGPHPTDEMILQNLLQNAFRAIAREVASDSDRPPIPDRYLAIKAYLEQNATQPVALADLARRFRISKPHLCSEFKRYFGVPVIEFVISVRLGQAMYLLQDVNLTIDQIALRVGYSEVSCLSRLFRQRFGKSPTAVRRTLRP